jgi:NhaP-type Na+/H+ or K+/H+ antiporter
VIDLLTVAIIVLAYGFVSKPLAARGITSAMALSACGLVAGTAVLGLIDVDLESSTAQRLAEGALVLLLFADAARIDLHSLRRHLAWPSRLLLVGMPLTMLAATGVGALVLPGVTVLTAFLLATMVSATDAALGQVVVTDTRVPDRVRQALDVESGLNDGLAVPFFLVAVDLSRAELTTGVTWAVVSNTAEQIGWGVVAGLAAGLFSGVALRFASRRDWIEGQWRQVIPLAAAALAYLIAHELGGSVFIAAFVGGMAFGQVARRHGHGTTYLTEETGELLAAITWVGFGALGLGWALPMVTWQIVVYAVLCLTLVRMVPVAIALARQGLQRPTLAFMGWFGPRGLASIVFGLLALESGVPDSDMVLATVVVTVALSVIAHGITSVPLVKRYSSWYAARATEHPEAAEAVPAAMSRLRRQPAVVELTADDRQAGVLATGDGASSPGERS